MNISTSFHLGTKPRKRPATYMYLTMQERQAVIKQINLTALFLLEYYLSVIARDNYVITDKKTASATGFSERSVRDNRLKLEKFNLFCVIKATGGMTSYLYCARKEGVYCMKYFDKYFGYNSVREVYRNFTRKDVADILDKENLKKMEVEDIKGLLESYHDKKLKTQYQNRNWE